MVNITLEYQPFSFFSYKRKLTGSFPSSFEELSAPQLIAVAGLINQTVSETSFLKSLTGFREYWVKKLDDYYCYQLMMLFEPFTVSKPFDTFIIPYIKTPQTILFSPKQKLASMTFGQFIFAESYFTNYQTDKNKIDLHKFIASLYLPELHPFNEDKIAAAALIVSRVKPEIPDAIVINYVLIKEWLALAYPLVFQHDQEDEETVKPKKLNNPNTSSAWLKIFENVVGDDLINQDKYAQLPLHNVLRWMTTKIKENIKRRLP